MAPTRNTRTETKKAIAQGSKLRIDPTPSEDSNLEGKDHLSSDLSDTHSDAEANRTEPVIAITPNKWQPVRVFKANSSEEPRKKVTTAEFLKIIKERPREKPTGPVVTETPDVTEPIEVEPEVPEPKG